MYLFPAISFGQNQIMSANVFEKKYDSILNRFMPIKGNKIYYDTIISVNGTKDELYSRVKRWELNTFKIADNPFATEDKESGFFSILTRISNGYKDYYLTRKIDPTFRGLDIHFKLRIYVKDNKARFIATDFTTDDTGIDDKYMESVLLNEVIIYDTSSNKKKYKTIDFKNKQLASISDFFNMLNFKIKLLTESFVKEINSDQENTF